MLERVQETWAASRFVSFLLLIFSGIALLLSMVGLYGVLSYSALRRLREIGIRLALGAQRSDIRILILGQGIRLLTHWPNDWPGGRDRPLARPAQLLFGVNALDPAIYLGVSLLLALAALLACWIPARRAADGDPIVALHYE